MNRCKLKAKKKHRKNTGDTIKQAIALHYDEAKASPVPQVTATGQNDIAEQIISLAREHNIPIHKDADLAVLLAQLELYEDIPETLYQAVAEVLAFAYIVSGKQPEKFKGQ